jgi:hypothetical protein
MSYKFVRIKSDYNSFFYNCQGSLKFINQFNKINGFIIIHKNSYQKSRMQNAIN